MARTKQTASQSTGGHLRGAQLSKIRTKAASTLNDYAGEKIIIAPGSSVRGIGFFPFQVYILASAASLISDHEFPVNLRKYIAFNRAAVRFNENCDWRPEIFTRPQASLLDCINHHEHEKQHRKSLGKGPLLLNRKELLVVDDVDWQTKGLLSVRYTAQLLGRDGSERDFENHANDRPRWQDEEQELTLPDLRQDLRVQHHPNANHLAESFLQFVWNDEGHEWALSSLMERNVALGWPDQPGLLESNTLPDKPVAKQITRGYLRRDKRPRTQDGDEDEEDDYDQFSSYHEWEDIITYGERCDPDTKMPKSLAYSMKRVSPSSSSSIQAPVQNIELDSVKTHEVIDSVESTCVDCSHVSHATSNTKFSFTLYVIGQAMESPQRWFPLLNVKLMRNVPWELHVYVVPDLAAALAHDDLEIATRPSSGRLPSSYAGPPEQLQSRIFLFIDENMQLESGPKIVTRDATTTDSELEVLYAGGWENAAQMIFTYIVTCAETPTIMALSSTDDPPSITASISLPAAHLGPGDCRAPEEMHLRLTLTLEPAAERSITINTRNTILTPNNFLWDSFLGIVDVETNEEIILPPMPAYWDTPQHLSVEQLQNLSFPFSATSPTRREILTLRPGKETSRAIIFKNSRFLNRYRSRLVEGKRYKVVLKPGQMAQRWIWGDLEHSAGSLGANAVSILDAGEIAEFTFDASRLPATSFAMPHCHIDG
ncbi:hypothetical protein QM012_005120 [Aureobasidium pullulans]|uniref:Uncharacterized protein n=1 Tax=Aureobasidium pullulans TaxID=5580 RepID=A0ABR0T5V5_AURPU